MDTKKKACVFFADGTEECEALLVVDILRRAGVDVTLAGVGEGLVRTSSHRVCVTVDAEAAGLDYNAFDAVVLPGGMPGTLNLAQSEDVARAARTAAANGRLLAAVCAAPTVLAKLGLLAGRRATAHHGFIDQLDGAVVVREPVVQDGNLVTGWGLGASIPFALRLAALLCGEETAAHIRTAIGYLGE